MITRLDASQRILVGDWQALVSANALGKQLQAWLSSGGWA